MVSLLALQSVPRFTRDCLAGIPFTFRDLMIKKEINYLRCDVGYAGDLKPHSG